MSRQTKNLVVVTMALMALAQLGCATCKTPPPFHVALEADRDLNGNLTTKVLLLQLKNLEAMQSVEFNELRKNPSAVLGPHLVGEPTVLTVSPGEAETHWIARDKDAQFIAAVAVFQHPDAKNWWSYHKLLRVRPLLCREVAVETLNRRPHSSEEQMRFYLRGSTITSEVLPRRPANQLTAALERVKR